MLSETERLTLRRDKRHNSFAIEAARACRKYAFTAPGFREVKE